MKKNLLFLFFIISAASGFAQPWQQIADFPSSARDDAAGFTIGTKVFIGTGLTSWFAPTRDFHVFNTFNETWDSIRSLPQGQERQYACGFASAAKGYIFGGTDGSQRLNDLWEFDPAQNLWTQKTSLPALGRSGASCFVIGNTAYIIGGQTDSTNASDEVWAYDISADSWIQKNIFPTGGSLRASAAANQNAGFLLFGKNENGAFSDELYQYNAQTDSWSQLATFPLAGRTYASLTSQGGFLYTAMGVDSLGTFFNDVWRFTIQTQQWTKLDTLPALPRRGGFGFINGGNTLAYTTGVNSAGVRVSETWKYALPIGLDEEAAPHKATVFPNPANDFISIQVPENSVAGGVSVRLISSVGNVVLRAKITRPASKLDIKQLPSGMYFVEILSANSTIVERFLKF